MIKECHRLYWTVYLDPCFIYLGIKIQKTHSFINQRLIFHPKFTTSWVKWITRSVCLWATQGNNPLIPFFTSKHTFFTCINAIFNILIYTHSFCTFNQRNPLKMGIQGNKLYIFVWYLKSEFFKKSFFGILNLKKSVCLKKWPLNLKQKIKPYFCNTHF